MSIELRVNETWDTPSSLASLSEWLRKVDDPIVTKSAMLMHNFIADNYTLTLKERNNK